MPDHQFALSYTHIDAGVRNGQRNAAVPAPRFFDSLEEAKAQPLPEGLLPWIETPDGYCTYEAGRWSFTPKKTAK